MSASTTPIPPGDWPRLLDLVEQALDRPEERRAAWARSQALPEALERALLGLLAERLAVEAGDFLGALPAVPGLAPVVTPRFAAGAVIGPWRLVRELGQGGMSVVWLAQRHDGQVDRVVALKLPHAGPGQEQLAQRMLRERRILAALEHPHIARLYDVGLTDDGTPYLVMEYVAGTHLPAHADARRLGLRERVVLFRQVLAAVQYAHGKLVLHRDLKPGNILVDDQGQVKLLDFGIAKLMAGDGEGQGAGAGGDRSQLTRGIGRQLTPNYASPEQWRGEALGTASDVYSLGVVLYELLCGQRPVLPGAGAGAGSGPALAPSPDEPAPPPSRCTPGADAAAARGLSPAALTRALRGDLDAIVLKALAYVPAQRYASAEALSADLARWLDGRPVGARGPGWWYPAGRFVRRHRFVLEMGSAVLVSVLAAGMVAVQQSRAARAEAERSAAARDFLLQLFDETDPARLRGQELTSAQRLELGRLKAESRLGEQGSLQAELLAGIGLAQYRAQEMVSADAAFATAAGYFEKMGDRVREADARLMRLRIATEERDFESVDGRLRDLRPLQSAIDRDPVLRLRWLEAQGRYAMLTGNLDLARKTLTECVRLADPADPRQAVAAFDAHLALAYVLRWAGARTEAGVHLARAAAMPSPGPELPAPERSMRLAQAEIDRDRSAGYSADTVQRLRQTISDCEQAMGRRSVRCTSFKLVLLGIHEGRGDVGPMQPLLAEGDEWLGPGLSPGTHVTAALMLSRALATSGVTDATRKPYAALAQAVAEDARPVLPLPARLPGLITLAEVRLRAGDVAAATRLLDEAEPLAERSGGERRVALLHVRVGRGLILQSAGRDAEALALAKGACKASPSDMDVYVHLMRLNCVRSLVATGAQDQAVRVVQEALPSLDRWLGEDAPNTQRARRLLQALQSPGGWKPPPWDGSQIFRAF